MIRPFCRQHCVKLWTGKPQFLVAILLSWSLSTSAGLAGDPFRTKNPQPIDETAEAAFNAIFRDGDYPTAAVHLEEARADEVEEPLVYALLASLAYLDEDWDALATYATETLTVAEALTEDNPLRGYLYGAIGHFLEGSHALLAGNEAQGVLIALSKLQQVYGDLDKARQVNPEDPELNLVQGFMDLLIAVNLPFANPEAAIEQLEQYAQPNYLADWGIALAYRDLKRFDQALDSVNRALAGTSDHPQLYYLRAQILREQGIALEDTGILIRAQTDFRRALAKSAQLPKALVSQVFREYCRNQNQIDQQARNCGDLRRPIQEAEGRWGPEQIPDLLADSAE